MNKTFEQWRDHVIKMKIVLAIDFDRVVEDWREEREKYKSDLVSNDVHSLLNEVRAIIDSLYGKRIDDMYSQALDDIKEKLSEHFR